MIDVTYDSFIKLISEGLTIEKIREKRMEVKFVYACRRYGKKCL